MFELPPWIHMLNEFLFEGSYSYYFPDIITLMTLRIILETSAQNEEVKINIAEIFEFSESNIELLIDEASELHTELSENLTKKAAVYEYFFRPLAQSQMSFKENYCKKKTKELVLKCESSENSYEKGRHLEELVEFLFTESSMFELVSKRYITGDEEIDLVMKNQDNEPFWLALSSPLVFIECKNWSSSVGTKELRDFEGKMRNHKNLVRLGYFISFNGFSKEVVSELKRGGRDDFHVVLLKKEDLLDYSNSDLTFKQWIERMTTVFY